MTNPNTSTSENDLLARGLNEIARRKSQDPMAFYEPASNKALAFHQSRATTRAMFGGNRCGKTEAALEEVLHLVRGNHPYQPTWKPPVYGRIVVPDFNQVEKVINDKLRRMTPPSLLKGSWEQSYNSRTHIISFSNGSKIDIMTHVQPIASFEGSARHFTLFDEEPPEDIYTSCILRHVDYHGRTLMSMTPLNGLTWIYPKIYLRSFTDPNVATWTLSIYENRFLTQEAIDEVEAMLTDEIDREIRLYGLFKSRTGLVFSNFDPNIHIYDPFETDEYLEWWNGYYPPADWPHGLGIDPGWGHPTGVIWCAINPDNLDRYYYREHRKSEMLPEDHAELIHSMNREMAVVAPLYVVDSQARATDQKGGSVWEDYRNSGIHARLATKKLHEGNIKLARSMRVYDDGPTKKGSQFHISRECPLAIEEIGEYQRRQSTDVRQAEQYVDKKNDLISAMRYINWEFDKMDIDGFMEDRQRQLEARLLQKRYNPLGKRQIDPDDEKRIGSPTTHY